MEDFLFLKYFHVVNKSNFGIFDELHWMKYFVTENRKEVRVQSWIDVYYLHRWFVELSRLICQPTVS